MPVLPGAISMSVEFDGLSVYDRIAASLARATELLELASSASSSEIADDLVALSSRWSALAERLQQSLRKEP